MFLPASAPTLFRSFLFSCTTYPNYFCVSSPQTLIVCLTPGSPWCAVICTLTLSPACLLCINSCPLSPLLYLCTFWSCSEPPQSFFFPIPPPALPCCALPVQTGGSWALSHFEAGQGLGHVGCLVRGHWRQVKPHSSMVRIETEACPRSVLEWGQAPSSSRAVQDSVGKRGHCLFPLSPWRDWWSSSVSLPEGRVALASEGTELRLGTCAQPRLRDPAVRPCCRCSFSGEQSWYAEVVWPDGLLAGPFIELFSPHQLLPSPSLPP